MNVPYIHKRSTVGIYCRPLIYDFVLNKSKDDKVLIETKIRTQYTRSCIGYILLECLRNNWILFSFSSLDIEIIMALSLVWVLWKNIKVKLDNEIYTERNAKNNTKQSLKGWKISVQIQFAIGFTKFSMVRKQ